MVALSAAVWGCDREPLAPSTAIPAANAAGAVFVTFDQLTMAPGERSSFQAAVLGARGLVGNGAGVAVTVRDTRIASALTRVTRSAAARVVVRAVAAGQTWVVVRSAAAAESVAVIVR